MYPTRVVFLHLTDFPTVIWLHLIGGLTIIVLYFSCVRVNIIFFESECIHVLIHSLEHNKHANEIICSTEYTRAFKKRPLNWKEALRFGLGLNIEITYINPKLFVSLQYYSLENVYCLSFFGKTPFIFFCSVVTWIIIYLFQSYTWHEIIKRLRDLKLNHLFSWNVIITSLIADFDICRSISPWHFFEQLTEPLWTTVVLFDCNNFCTKFDIEIKFSGRIIH